MNESVQSRWEESYISEHFELLIGGTPSRSNNAYWDNEKLTGNKWVSIKDIKERYISETEEQITDLGVEKSNVKVIPENTVIMSFKLTIGRLAITKCQLYTNEAIVSFIPKKSNSVDTNYLYYGLQSWNLLGEADQAVKGATLNKDKMSRIFGFFPPLHEQKKIASILISVDEVIENTQKQIDKLQDLKKATMNELLTKGIGHTEFKDSELGRIPKSWEVKRLLEIGQCVRGLTYAPENIVKNGLLVLRSSNIQDGRLSFNDNVFVNLKIDDHFLSQDGDILICVRNGSRHLLGKSALIIGNRPQSTHGAFMTIFRTENYKFVRFLIQSEWFFTQVSRDIGATINSINNNNLLEYRFVFPPLDEQSKISNILNSIERRIDSQKQRLHQIQSLKKSLMQDLLTGKVRVKVN